MIFELGNHFPAFESKCSVNPKCHVDVKKIKLSEAAKVFYQQERRRISSEISSELPNGLNHVVHKTEGVREFKKASSISAI
jgi:hypothetical protein